MTERRVQLQNRFTIIIGTTATTDKYVQMAGEFVSNVAKREPSSLLAEENTQELPFDLLALYDNLI